MFFFRSILYGNSKGDHARTMRLSWLLATLAFAASGPSHGQSQLEMSEAARKELLQANQRLDKIHAAITARLDPEANAILNKAQGTWRRFRDEECEFQASTSQGGSIHSMVVYGCRASLTNERARQLEHQLTCQEDDLTCVRPSNSR